HQLQFAPFDMRDDGEAGIDVGLSATHRDGAVEISSAPEAMEQLVEGALVEGEAEGLVVRGAGRVEEDRSRTTRDAERFTRMGCFGDRKSRVDGQKQTLGRDVDAAEACTK